LLADRFTPDKFTQFVFATRIEASNRDFSWALKSHRPSIQKIDESSGEVIFEDGSTGKYDMIMFCTGFQYKFPFFEDELLRTQLASDSHRKVPSLYKHVFHCDYPDGSLAFIGLPWSVSPFPLTEIQSHWVMHGMLHLSRERVSEIFEQF
jgi:hypothetical protein